MKLLSRLLTSPGAAALVATALVLLMVINARASFATGAAHTIELPLIRYNKLTPTPTPTTTATPSGDPHFGVIVSSDLGTVMSETGLTWWYQFNAVTPSIGWTSVAQIALRRSDGSVTRIPAATLVAGAQAHPGSYWLIGNEPNVGGQDGVSATQYATELDYYLSTIKGADSTAKIVGPNILNWDRTCNLCGGYPSGHSWVDGFRTAWAAGHVGAEPPFDVWALHAYQIDWNVVFSQNLPMTDPAPQEADIAAMSSYLGAIGASAQKPIWLSEYGVLWAFDGATFPTGGCAAGTGCIGPKGPYDQAAVSTWLNQFDGWLAANAATNRLQRWFLYTSFGQPESYTTTYAGVSVVTSVSPGASLSTSGQIYRQQSLTPVP